MIFWPMFPVKLLIRSEASTAWFMTSVVNHPPPSNGNNFPFSLKGIEYDQSFYTCFPIAFLFDIFCTAAQDRHIYTSLPRLLVRYRGYTAHRQNRSKIYHTWSRILLRCA